MIAAAEVKTSRDGDTITVTAGGELDLSNAGELFNALETAVQEARDVVVDLRTAVFVDTAILACLAGSGSEMLDGGRRLRVKVKAGSHPDYVLKTVRFGELMDIEASE